MERISFIDPIARRATKQTQRTARRSISSWTPSASQSRTGEPGQYGMRAIAVHRVSLGNRTITPARRCEAAPLADQAEIACRGRDGANPQSGRGGCVRDAPLGRDQPCASADAARDRADLPRSLQEVVGDLADIPAMPNLRIGSRASRDRTVQVERAHRVGGRRFCPVP